MLGHSDKQRSLELPLPFLYQDSLGQGSSIGTSSHKLPLGRPTQGLCCRGPRLGDTVLPRQRKCLYPVDWMVLRLGAGCSRLWPAGRLAHRFSSWCWGSHRESLSLMSSFSCCCCYESPAPHFAKPANQRAEGTHCDSSKPRHHQLPASSPF